MKKFLTLMVGALYALTSASQGFDQQAAYEGLYSMLTKSFFDEAASSQSLDLTRNIFTANTLTTDEAYCVWYDAGVPEYNKAMPTEVSPLVSSLWTTIFLQINHCNAFLENATGTDAVTQRQRAEARTLRALLYTYAIDFWGDVPLWLSSSPATVSRTPRAEVFAFIEQELQASMPLLDVPATAPYGHVTQGVARLLLARLYLNAEVYTGKARWADARQQAGAVINAGWYSLSADYSRLFMGDNNVNGAQTEMVLPLEVTPDMGDNWGNTTYLIASTRSFDMPDCGLSEQWAGLITRTDLLRKFATADDRYLFYGIDRRDGSVLPTTDFHDGYSCVKYTNTRADGTVPASTSKPDTDFPLLRLAEAYLIFAEADTRLNGGICTGDGLLMLNAVRQRAHAGALTSATLSDLADEWSREFYFEGLRRPTLIRFGLYSSGLYQWTGRGSNVMDLFPLPADICVANDFQQNPGYEDFSYKPSSLTMDAPLFGDATVDLQRFQTLRFSWQRPADATTTLTYEVCLSLADSTQSMVLIATEDLQTDITTTTLYDALKALGATDESEVKAQVHIVVHGVASSPVTVNLRLSKPSVYATNDMWCMTGSNMANGTWQMSASALGSGMIPLYSNARDARLFAYTGYFPEGQFKIVGNYNWSNQFGYGTLNGIESWIAYADGENIQVYTPGYYTINVYGENASVEAYTAATPVYKTVCLPGSHNGWDTAGTPLTPMSTAAGSINHDWYATVTFAEDAEVKFAADNAWDTNWGGKDFPLGTGEGEGPNINVKAGTYKVVFNDITGQYMFLNPETGQTPTSLPLTDGYFLNTDYATIDATSAEPVKVKDINGRVKIALLPAGADYSSLTLIVNGRPVTEVATDGTISAEAATQFYAGKPYSDTVRVAATMRGFAVVNGLGVYTSSPEFTITFVQQVAPMPRSNYYYIGGLTGWASSRSMAFAEVADNVFQLVWQIPANTDEWFKIVPESAMSDDGGQPDWDNLLCADSNGATLGRGTMAIGNAGAWHIDAQPVEKTYTLTIDMRQMTYLLEEGNTSAIAAPTAAGRPGGILYGPDGLQQRSTSHKGVFISNGKKMLRR